MDNGYLLVGLGLLGGFVLSQINGIAQTCYKIVTLREKNKEKTLYNFLHKHDIACKNLQKEIQAQKTYNWEFLKKSTELMDEKLSLVLTKLTSSSGGYKTNMSIDANSLEQLREMNQIVENVGGEIVNNYKDALAKYSTRLADLEEETVENDSEEDENVIDDKVNKLRVFRRILMDQMRDNGHVDIIDHPRIEGLDVNSPDM